MGTLFRQTTHKADDSGVSGLYRGALCYPLCPAGDDCPLKFLVGIPQAQQRFDDAEDSQHPFFLLFDDQLRTPAFATGVWTDVGRDPEQLVERTRPERLLNGVDAGGCGQLQKLRVRVGLPYPVQLGAIAPQQKYFARLRENDPRARFEARRIPNRT